MAGPAGAGTELSASTGPVPARVRGERGSNGLEILATPRTRLPSELVNLETAVIAEIPVDPFRARLYAEGWQSWSRAQMLTWNDVSPGPGSERLRTHFHRPGLAPSPDWPWRAEGGLLAIDPGNGDAVRLFTPADPASIPLLLARPAGKQTITVCADRPCQTSQHTGTLDAALRDWASGWGQRLGATVTGTAPSGWCSWYGYKRGFDLDVLAANLDVMDRYDLPVDVVQLDDGWQEALGDWEPGDRFPSLPALADQVTDRGRALGLWLTPFTAHIGSRIVAEHPEWWIADLIAPFGMEADTRVLDITHPGARDHLAATITRLTASARWLKLDFLYAGALDGKRHEDVDALAAYRDGLALIREAAGPDTFLVGCGSPVLASVGAGLDAIRTSPDTSDVYEPPGGDLTQPAGRSALETGRARAYLHHAALRVDLDCIITRPTAEHRGELADHIASLPGGLRVSGDPLPDLDQWGLETTRRLLSS